MAGGWRDDLASQLTVTFFMKSLLKARL